MKTQVLKKETELKLNPRPPVVTILGHVDHGKTSILDAIRGTKVAEKEYGGITQHTRAFQVAQKGRKITFIDTPGHEVFKEMRFRGAKIGDIALLVVDAADGVMPQTKESIQYIKEARIKTVVALNKIDLPTANPKKVKEQLVKEGITVEEYGGEVVCAEISAKTGKGLEELLDILLLVYDLEEPKLNQKKELRGVVLESYLDKAKGPIALVLIQNGVLKLGNEVLVGSIRGKIRALIDSDGRILKEVSESVPVEVLGLQRVPAVGETLALLKKGSLLEEEIQKTQEKKETRIFDLDESFFDKNELRLIFKSDTIGTLEAVSNLVEKLPSAQKIKIINSGVGGITESDVLLAESTKAIVLGFNVKVSESVLKLAENEKVHLKIYKLIYELIDELKEVVSFVEEKEVPLLAQAKVSATFETKDGLIAGCQIKLGTISLGETAVVKRGGKIIGKGKIISLKQKKKSIEKCTKGEECGLFLDTEIQFASGDIIEIHGS